MATKKDTEFAAKTHESLMAKIKEAEALLKAKQDEYKAFCKENPLTLGAQPSLHELRKMREKLSPSTLGDHAKANAAAASAVQRAQIVEQVKSEVTK